MSHEPFVDGLFLGLFFGASMGAMLALALAWTFEDRRKKS